MELKVTLGMEAPSQLVDLDHELVLSHTIKLSTVDDLDQISHVHGLVRLVLLGVPFLILTRLFNTPES